MSNLKLLEYQRVAVELAERAGYMMMAKWGRNTDVSTKLGFADIVTETDKEVEAFLFGELKNRYPDHIYIGEETANSKQDLTDTPTWMIDPIDGTMNYYHQLSYCCVSIGLVINKQPVVGVVYSPAMSRMYSAAKGFGATCNGRPIQVKSNHKTLSESLVITWLGCGGAGDAVKKMMNDNLNSIAWKCHGLRCFGSAAMSLCTIAEGGCDAYFEFGIHCWDMCASVAIVREAGGHVFDANFGEFDIMSRKIIAAATPELAKEISQLIKFPVFDRDDTT